MRVGVIDYGVGNLGSVLRALEELRTSPSLIDRAVDMHAMDALVLPGVGSFADCIGLLNEGGWTEALTEEVSVRKRPLLGICVGMQLLATRGTEGADSSPKGYVEGLNLIPGSVEHLSACGCKLRLPHVGWNSVDPSMSTGGLFHGIPVETDFYFVHSYAFRAENAKDVIATTSYGVPITAAVRRDNVWGTQFHPEKSSRAGFSVLRNFIEGR